MGLSPQETSAEPDNARQSDWFDFATLLGGAPVKAILSQRNSDYQEISVDRYRKGLASQQGLPFESIAIPQQVHGNKVQLAIPGRIHKDTDGLLTIDPHAILSLQVADCAPVFFYHQPTGFRGLVHAGWRGLASGILTVTAGLLQAQDVDLCQTKVVIGPTIEMACFEVGAEVTELFSPTIWQPNSSGRFQLDLVAAVRDQLIEAGIPGARINSVDICTRCDSRCHSYRRDGELAGRMVAFFYVDSEIEE
ncbi:MAG: polyphenol oxidase family protein [Fidelibacterota bacterium]|nr:MAG: polyphenol oxidase family protein [Candidatus Neomarinimicrobiota bacterium]